MRITSRITAAIRKLTDTRLMAAILLLIAMPVAAETLKSKEQPSRPITDKAEAASSETIDPALRNALHQAARDTSSFNDHFEAQVWLADMSGRLSRKVKDKQYRLSILKTAHFEAKRAGLKPELVLAVIDVESNFNPAAVSHAGARGLMQIMPFWKKEIGKQHDSLFNIRTNLRYGCTILKYYLDKENGNLFRALGRYNGSRGRWRYPKKVYQAYNKRWFTQ